MKIPVQVNGVLIKSVIVPEGLSNKQEYDFLYAALYNDPEVRSAIGMSLKKVVHTPKQSVNLITGA
jgi:hypothetical protein